MTQATNTTLLEVQSALAVRVSIVAGVIIGAAFFIIGLVALLKSVKSGKTRARWSNVFFRIRVWQIIASLWLFTWLFIAFFEFFVVDWRGNGDGCFNMITAHIIPYLLEKQAINFFLYERAKLVQTSLNLNSKGVVRLRWGMWLAVTGLVGFIWSAFVLHDYVILTDGACVQVTVLIPVASIFMFGDFFLGLAFLAMFVVPIYQHTRKVSKDSRLFYDVIKKNLVFSTIISLVGIFGFAVHLGLSIVYLQNRDGMQHLPTLALILSILDTIVGVVIIHLIAKSWLSDISCGLCDHLEEAKVSDEGSSKTHPQSPPTSRWMPKAFNYRSSGRLAPMNDNGMSQPSPATVYVAGSPQSVSTYGSASPKILSSAPL